MRHTFALAAVLAVAGACSHSSSSSASAPPAGVDASLYEKAKAIHARVFTIDTHKDIPDNFATPAADPKTMNAQVNLDKMKAGGYDMAFFAVYVGQGARTDSGNGSHRRS